MIENHDKNYIIVSKEQKIAQKNRAFGILIAVLVFALLIYIATYAKFGT